MVLGAWLARDGAGDFDPLLVWNSAYPATLAALAAVVVALPVAHAAASGPGGRWLERISSFGFGVPGIVMGTALVYVGLRLDYLYQTVALLVIGYVLRFLPLAIGAIRVSVARVDAGVLGAARSLGASPLEVFRRVSMPLILPGVVAGGALVFLEAMRELPATLLLRPTGLETLTTRLWEVYEAGYYGYAAMPALLLIGVSAVALVIMLSGEDRLTLVKGT
jgi:iron(III) transport system permease protein